MAARGFALVKGSRFEYTREVNGVHHYIGAQQSQWSPAMWIQVYMKGDESTPGYVAGGRLGSREVEVGGQAWPAANEAEATSAFPSILHLVDRCALPYFEKIKGLPELRRVEQYIRQRGVAGIGSTIDDALRSSESGPQ
jgi:hypothetical protein